MRIYRFHYLQGIFPPPNRENAKVKEQVTEMCVQNVYFLGSSKTEIVIEAVPSRKTSKMLVD